MAGRGPNQLPGGPRQPRQRERGRVGLLESARAREAEEERLTTGSEWLGKRVARTSPSRSMSLCGLSLAYLTAHLAVILLQSSAWAVTNDCQCLDPAALNASSYPATHLPANAYHLFILPYAK